MVDQFRPDFLASAGFELDTMPYLDGLARQGYRFTRAYTTMPICVPARLSLMTGRFPKAHGIIANWPDPRPRYSRDLPGVLAEQGYSLGLLGKNHTHLDGSGFDAWRSYDHTAGPPRPGHEAEDAAFDRWMTDLGHWVAREPTPFPVASQYPARIVDDTLQWLDERQAHGDERPFCAFVSFPEPHSPYQVPEPYFSLFSPDRVPPPRVGPEALSEKNLQWRNQRETIEHFHPRLDEDLRLIRSRYCGMLRLIDDQVRRLVEGLRTRGELERTLAVFTADHGEFCGDFGLARKGLALPEVEIRIPQLWFGGAVAAAASSQALVSLADVMPTICEAVGAPIPKGVQGRSLWPLLQGSADGGTTFQSMYVEHGVGGAIIPPPVERTWGHPGETVFIDGVARTNFDGTIVATSGYRRALIKGPWKLVYDLELPLELYDLAADPDERQNRASDPEVAAVLADLQAELLWWSVRLDDNLLVQRYEVAHPPHHWAHRASSSAAI